MSVYYILIRIDEISEFLSNGTLPTNLLVVFVALGILLILILVAALIYYFVKINKNKKESTESFDQKKSMPIHRPQKEGMKTLPVGTALKDGLYQIEAYIESSDQVNLYRIRRTQPLYHCTHCHTELNNDTAAFCRVCGTALGVIPPTFPQYLLRESSIENIFLTSERIIGMNLHHPSLVLPIEAFSEKEDQIKNYYLIEPYDQKPTLSSVKLPLPLETVLDIGVSLAEGLSYLHNYSAVLKTLDLENVVFMDNTAKWLCHENVDLLSSDQDSQYALRFSENIRKLVQMLQLLLVGTESTQKPTPLPDEIKELFTHYLNENVTTENLVRSLRQANRMLGGHNIAQFYLGMQSDVGRLRKINEDSMILNDLSSQYEEKGLSIVIGGVADGVGGQAAGDVASQLTVQTIKSHIDNMLNYAQTEHIPEPRDWLTQAAISANEIVYQERTKAGNNMASTLVLAMFTGDLCTILNVGDSRAYLMNRRGIRQITTDHSLVERLVAIGEITRDEARRHPRKSVIYRVIGDRLNLDYDIFTQSFEPGEALLMCSDGLSDMVEDATIWRIWRSATSPQDTAEQLIVEANTAGGTDNITVVIVELTK